MYMICFILKRIKFFVFLKAKTSQRAIKTSLAECSMLITFLKSVISVKSIRLLMPAGWLQKYFNTNQTPSTFENRIQVLRYNPIIFHKNIFSLKPAEK